MTKKVIDTNIILRYLLQDIPAQADYAESLFTDAKNGRVLLFIPQLVIFEILFNLLRIQRLDKAEVIDKLKAILATPYLEIESKTLLSDALELSAETNIEFVDCFLLSYAKQIGGEVVTFDKKLGKKLS